MKRYRFSFVLSVLLISITILGSFSVKSLGAETIDFTFNNNELIDTSEYDTFFNMRNQSEYSGHYPATYSFENDIIGEIPDDWTVAEVIENYQGHDMVVLLNDTTAEALLMSQEISSIQESGSVEFWINMNQTDKICYVVFYVKWPLIAFTLRIENTGEFKITHADGITKIGDYEIETWYHFQFDFECNNGGYIGLSNDTFNVYLNGLLKIDGYNFSDDGDELYALFFNTHIAQTDILYYIDAIGYSWDNGYNIGDNLVPILDINESIQEVDRWEFCINEATKEFRESESVSSVLGWSAMPADELDIEDDEHDVDDKQLRFYNGLGFGFSNIGMEKDFNLKGTLLNITFSLERDDFGASDDPDGWSVFDFYDNDSNLITRLNITFTTLEYWDGSNYIELYDGINDLVYYEFNLYLNYGLAFLRFYIDGTLENVYYLDLINDVVGLNKIDFHLYAPTVGNVIEIWIDYIGVYENGLSISTDVGYLSISNIGGMPLPFGFRYWSFVYYNLFSLDIRGNISITYTNNGLGYIYNYYKPSFHVFDGDFLELLFDWNVYNESFFRDIYDEYKVPYNSSINFLVIGDVIFNSLQIQGIILTDGINDFSPTITGGNINRNVSHFWVDSSARLQYILIANDNENEYIQATFYITDISTENRSIRFSSNINGNAYGFFAVNYYDTTSMVLEIPYYPKTTIVILPQTKIVDSFRILITDNDLTNDTICTGYISNIKLIYYPDLQVSIDTLNLLAIIVPLIIMIAPPIALHKKFGTSGVFVMFILMSLVCVATGLIPIWLFFIIALSSIGLLAMKKEVGERL